MEREVFVGDAQISEEVIFSHSNGAFSRISAVPVRRNELAFNVEASHELLEGVGCFIIELWEPLFEAIIFGQQSNHSFIGVVNLRADLLFIGSTKIAL